MTTTLEDRHPLYLARLADWEVMAHTYEGERCVKEQTTKYLKATSGMINNGFGKDTLASNVGLKAYEAYISRAVFPPFVFDAIDGLVGMVHRKPPKVEVPKVLEPMIKKASVQGEDLCQVWRRITEHQLRFGSLGLLIDVPSGLEVDKAIPYIAFYSRMAIPNWDPGVRSQGMQKLELVVLDESTYERKNGLRWEYVSQYRVLATSKTVATFGKDDQSPAAMGDYMVGVVRIEMGSAMQTAGSTAAPQPIDLTKATWMSPSLGGRHLDAIPFVFINTNDVVPEPCGPPLIGLANLSLSIYRQEADYKQALHMQGQDTLCRIGASEDQKEQMTGTGSILDVPMGGDAKYIGPESQGIPEMRTSLENDRAMAGIYATKMQEEHASDAESGEALRVRVTARTATLVSLQRAAAQGIKDALTYAGRWMGVSDEELEKIVVEPNLDFTDDTPTAADLDTLMSAKQKGLPLSLESIHGYLKGHEFTTMEYEDEIKTIEEEQTTLGMMGAAQEDLDPYAEDEELDEDGNPIEKPAGDKPNGKKASANGKKPNPFAKKGAAPPK